jgi:hypothetical protein
MFLRKAALRRVPRYAVVGAQDLDEMERDLDTGPLSLQDRLDHAYREMDQRQPALASYLADEVIAREDELAQSVGYFLVTTLYLAFREAFPRRLLEVEPESLSLAIQTLQVDEELRRSDPAEVLESDDVVAMGQPELVRFVQHHLEEALAQAEGEVDLEAFDQIYRALLVEIIALSHAVGAPKGQSGAEHSLS